MGGEVWDCELPYHDVPYVITRDVLLYEWCRPHWKKNGSRWVTKKRDGYADGAMRFLRRLSNENRRGDFE
jgi:hypothetical protein